MTHIYIYVILIFLCINAKYLTNKRFMRINMNNNAILEEAFFSSIFTRNLSEYHIFSLGNVETRIKKQIINSQQNFSKPLCAIFFNDHIENIEDYNCPFARPKTFLRKHNTISDLLDDNIPMEHHQIKQLNAKLSPKFWIGNIEFSYKGLRDRFIGVQKMISRANERSGIVTDMDKDWKIEETLKESTRNILDNNPIDACTIKSKYLEWNVATSAFCVGSDSGADVNIDDDLQTNYLPLIHTCLRLAMAAYNLDLAVPI